jgi:hypothetical protein
LEDIAVFIRKSGVSKVELKMENIQSLIDTLIFDGKIEKHEEPKANNVTIHSTVN